MSKKFWSALVAFGVGSFLSSCNFASPETYFDEAVLNVNLITPFGGQAALSSLAQPSVKLVPGTKDQAAPMARKATPGTVPPRRRAPKGRKNEHHNNI